MTDDIDDFLAHYGVKGMKWGVIRKELGKQPTNKAKQDYLLDVERDYISKFSDTAVKQQLIRAARPEIDKGMKLLEKDWDDEDDFLVSLGYQRAKTDPNETWEEFFVSGKGADSFFDIYVSDVADVHARAYEKAIEQTIGKVSPSGIWETVPSVHPKTLRVTFVTRYNQDPKNIKRLRKALEHAEQAPSSKIVEFTKDVYRITQKGLVRIDPEEVEHAMDDAEDFLAHYGVKGMKWGVRRDLKGIRGASNRTAYLKKKDAAWIDKVNANPKLEKISRMVAKDTKSALKQLNRAYPKKFGMRNKADQARYDRALEETIAASIDRAAYKTHKLSPTRAHEVKVARTESGELLAQVTRRTNAKIIKTEAKLNRMDERAKKKEIAHAEEDLSVEDFEGLGFLLLEDEDGLVVDVVTPFDGLEHVEQVDDFLAHYGVKGMRWGVRKDRSSSSGGRQQKKSSGDKEDDNTRRKATKSKSELSRYSDDKLTSMTANLKGLDALSDAELKKLTGRMQLEQTYRDLLAKQPKTKSKAEKFLDGAKLLGNTANQLNEFLNTPAGKALQSKLKSKVKK